MVIRLSTSRANRSCPGTSRQLFARRAAVAVLISVSWLCHGQAPAARPEIGQYIHNSWDTLSRSMNECKSVVDLKVTTAPILYLPAGMATPPAVTAMQTQCSVQVAHLPRKINQMGDVSVAEIPKEGTAVSAERLRGAGRPVQRDVWVG